jgi:hypothetical protein
MQSKFYYLTSFTFMDFIKLFSKIQGQFCLFRLNKIEAIFQDELPNYLDLGSKNKFFN